jgi:hypothetical protein
MTDRQCTTNSMIKVHTLLNGLNRDEFPEAKCPCNRCQNRRMSSEYEMSGLIAKHGFMLNYLVRKGVHG